MMKNDFYVTSYSTGIDHRCVTPLYCNNSIQHKHAAVANMQHVMQGWLYININGVQTSIVFERDALNNWFEFATTAAIKTYSISAATQGTML